MAKPLKVGQQMVCIDDSGFAKPYGEIVPILNGVYTIRDILHYPAGVCLRFNEIVNSVHKYDNATAECSFKQSRFKVKTGH